MPDGGWLLLRAPPSPPPVMPSTVCCVLCLPQQQHHRQHHRQQACATSLPAPPPSRTCQQISGPQSQAHVRQAAAAPTQLPDATSCCCQHCWQGPPACRLSPRLRWGGSKCSSTPPGGAGWALASQTQVIVGLLFFEGVNVVGPAWHVFSPWSVLLCVWVGGGSSAHACLSVLVGG